MKPRSCAWPRCDDTATERPQRSLLGYCPFHGAQVRTLRAALDSRPPDDEIQRVKAPWADAYCAFFDNDYDRHEDIDTSAWEAELRRAKRKQSQRAVALIPKCTRCARVSALDPCRRCATESEQRKLCAGRLYPASPVP